MLDVLLSFSHVHSDLYNAHVLSPRCSPILPRGGRQVQVRVQQRDDGGGVGPPWRGETEEEYEDNDVRNVWWIGGKVDRWEGG
eukprot:9484847-Pyramimonas_sp.AAC.1